MENEFSIREKLSYGIGACGKGLVYAIAAAYVMARDTDVEGVSPGMVAGLFLHKLLQN